MPTEIAVHGVLIPAAVALAIVVAAGLLRAIVSPEGRIATPILQWLDARAVTVALAATFAMSYGARQGWQWPPRSAWEWLAPLIVAVAAVGCAAPWPASRAARAVTALFASFLCGAMAAWALALIDLATPPWRAGIGGATALTALVVLATLPVARRDGASRIGRGPPPRDAGNEPSWTDASASALMAISIGGLGIVMVAAGFEKLATISFAVATTLAAVAALALLMSLLARRGPVPGLGGVLVSSAFLVGAAAVAAAYLDSLPRWHWFAAVAAPLAGLLAAAWRCAAPRRRGWGVAAALVAASAISLGNALLALGPLIARGEFPPR